MALATKGRPSVAGKANPPAAKTASVAGAKTASKPNGQAGRATSTPVAAPGEALRRANRVKGGFLDGKTFEITGARAVQKTIEAKDFKTGVAGPVDIRNLEVEFAIEGVDNPVTRDYSLGAAFPSEDGVTIADEGQFVCGEPGKQFKGLHENCAASVFLNSILDKGGYDEDTMVNEGFAAALTGVRGVLEEYTPPQSDRDKKAGKKPPRSFPIAQSIEGGSGAGEEVQSVEAEEAAEESAEGEPASLEDRVRELVVDLVSKGAITKTKLTQAVGKAFDGDADKMKAVSMAVKDSFLKGMAGEGLVTYDGREVGPVE